jgi:CelD/BcsL family acetyltransferase involved in cellulose biosynthesis
VPIESDVEAFESLRSAWSELAAATENVFATWEWNTVWWKRLGGGRTLHIEVDRDAHGHPIAILPLFLWHRSPLRVVRQVGCEGGDELGPICRPDDRVAAAGALLDVLGGLRAHVFLGECLPRDAEWRVLLGGSVLSHEASPVIALDAPDWDAFLRTRSSNFREQVRRRERKLFRERNARFRLAEDPSRLDADLDALFALHAARWEGRPTSFMRREPLHREFARHALELGWLRLWLLEVDGAPRAACLGFRYGGVESYYQGGRDPAWDAYSVGFVLLAHAVREALAGGMREYRLLRGGEPYKYRFATSDTGVETIAVARGPGARAAVAAARVARRAGLVRAPRL